MRFSTCIAAALMVLPSSFAHADGPPALKPSLIRGVVDSFNGKVLAIKTASGAVMSFPVTASTHFAIVLKKSFSQLKPTEFIGVTAVPGQNGHLRAEEIHTIPIHMNEGQYPWDHHPSIASAPTMASSMTNGTVIRTHVASGTVTATSGSQLLMSYHGAAMVDGKCEGMVVSGPPGCTGTAVVDVTPQTLIQAIVPSFHPDVKPGLAVNAGIGTDTAGRQVLTSATLESNGVKPEF